MKYSILVLIILALAVPAWAGGESGKLTVVIKNFENTDGKVMVALFNSDETWLENGQNRKAMISEEKEATVVFENLEPGSYAISVFHDENDNGEMDTGAFGIPEEAYGFSNDARGMFGPASFEDSSFSIDGDKTIEINVK